jgi:hypothetical protein
VDQLISISRASSETPKYCSASLFSVISESRKVNSSEVELVTLRHLLNQVASEKQNPSVQSEISISIKTKGDKNCAL